MGGRGAGRGGRKKGGGAAWFYAVRRGRRTGVFASFEACRPLVEGFGGADFRKFRREADAVAYAEGGAGSRGEEEEEEKPGRSESSGVAPAPGKQERRPVAAPREKKENEQPRQQPQQRGGSDALTCSEHCLPVARHLSKSTGAWYLCCPVKEGIKRCRFMVWEKDAEKYDIPLCPKHLRPATMDRSKTTGRKFFSCGFSGGRSCGFVAWANGGAPAPVASAAAKPAPPAALPEYRPTRYDDMGEGDVRSLLAQQESLAADASLMRRAADGGRKIRETLAELRQAAANMRHPQRPARPPVPGAAAGPPPGVVALEPSWNHDPKGLDRRAGLQLTTDGLPPPLSRKQERQRDAAARTGRRAAGGGASSGGGGKLSRKDVDGLYRAMREAAAAAGALRCGGDDDDDDDKGEEPALRTRLMPHQRAGVAWMRGRERGTPAGGMLADDMGLGKTLQLIALAAGDREGATLVVCPKALLSEWEAQVLSHVRAGELPVRVYHGPRRDRGAAALGARGLVVTTYSVVRSEHGGCGGGGGKDETGLFAVEWRRVVLDEAHEIRNAATKTTKAVCALRAERRWMLSGTFVQNSLDDLYSAFQFLRHSPYDRKATWRALVRPAASEPDESAALRRVSALLATVLLRRTKQDRLPGGRRVVELPPRTVTDEWVELRGDERARYERLRRASRREREPGYARALVLLLRLRQAACDSSLVPVEEGAAAKGDGDEEDKAAAEKRADEVDGLGDALAALSIGGGDDDGDGACELCGDALDRETVGTATAACGHRFCRECVQLALNRAGSPGECPACGDALSRDGVEFDGPDASPGSAPPSSKVAYLLGALRRLSRDDPSAKSVVFSQWTGLLDRAGAALRAAGVTLARVDGSVPADRAAAELRRFRDADAGVRVLLLSLRSGGVGLNLTAATHVFMLDCWWNPAVEEQAFDRVYRVGQTRPTFVHRLLARDTVEEAMLRLQEAKRRRASGALGSRARLGLDELRDLFL